MICEAECEVTHMSQSVCFALAFLKGQIHVSHLRDSQVNFSFHGNFIAKYFLMEWSGQFRIS